MAYGSIIRITVMYGSLIMGLNLCLIPAMVIGYLQILAGPGYLITAGDGHHFTMDVGIMMIITVGSGCLIISGVQLGYAGEQVQIIMDGHL